MPAVWQKSWIIVQWLIKARSIPVPPALSLPCVYREQSHGTFSPASDEEEDEAWDVYSGLAKKLPLIFVQRTKPCRLSGTVWKMCFHSVYSKYNCSFFVVALFKKAIVKFQENLFCASCHGDWLAQWAEDSWRGGWGQSSHLPYYCSGGTPCIITV